MSLIEKLRKQSEELLNETETKKQEVINEIKEHFNKYFNNSKNLEQFVEMLSEHYIEKRQVPIMTNFWEYHSGCRSTNFYCGGCYWYPNNNEYNSDWYYKGVYLKEIQFEVCSYLKEIVKQEMLKLGFVLKNETYANSRFGYYENTMYFGW